MPAEWERPAVFPPLILGEVQVWRIDLPEGEVDEESYLSLLTAEEASRAGRLRAGLVRLQFLSGRSGVRALLGAHLGIAPAMVAITTGEYGRPELAPPFADKVFFNVAHSRSTVLIALSLDGPVGIDIEYLDRKTEVEEVTRHSLTEGETALMLSIGDTKARSEFFFTRWTRKEAVVKADGRGLSLPLTSFDAPADDQSLVRIPSPDLVSDRTYFVTDIEGIEGAACALATADRPSAMRLLMFSPHVNSLA